MISLLLVDDYPPVRRALRAWLAAQSDIAIVIDDSPQQSALGGVVQYDLKFNFLASC